MRHRVRVLFTALTAVALLVIFAKQTRQAFGELPVAQVLLGAVGNASVPYSDALGPWLHGALSYYLRHEPLAYVPRPTLALLFSSVLSVTGSVASIPVAWVVLFLGGLTGLLLAASWEGRAAITASLACLVVGYAELVRPLNPEALMPDFLAMALGFVGVWCVALAAAGDRPVAWPVVAGFLLLGLSATIRGPQLLAGFGLLAYLGAAWVKRRPWPLLVLAPAVFLLPGIVEGAIQLRYGIRTNGVVALYSFYTDATHSWSPATHERFVAESPSNRDVASRYVGFLFSVEGARAVAQKVSTVLRRDVEILRQLGFCLVLAGCVGIALLTPRTASTIAPPFKAIARAGFAVAALAAVAIIAAPSSLRPWCLAFALAGLSAAAWATGRSWTVMFAVAYAGAMLFHALLGLVGGTRVIATYEPFLYAALVSVWFRAPAVTPAAGRRLSWVAAALCAAVVVCYGGTVVADTASRARLRQALAAPNTAVKISENVRLDRSLYMTGQLGLFYTRQDDAPVWTVRTFRRIDPPSGWSNPSYLHPVAVEWIDGPPSRE